METIVIRKVTDAPIKTWICWDCAKETHKESHFCNDKCKEQYLNTAPKVCPKCGSGVITPVIHGAFRVWWCQICGGGLNSKMQIPRHDNTEGTANVVPGSPGKKECTRDHAT